jgi:predicted S18 family serine protease
MKNISKKSNMASGLIFYKGKEKQMMHRENDETRTKKQKGLFFEERLGRLLRVDRFKYGWRSVWGTVVCLIAVGFLNTGVNASDGRAYGKGKTTNKATSVDKTKQEFESLMRDLAASNVDDDLTRQAREYVRNADNARRYAEEEKFYRSQAKMYREKLASERINLRDAAAEIGEKEGYTKREALRIIDSQRPEDRSLRNSWIEQAQRQERTK